MKKQTKRLLILAIVLVACVAVYVAVALITKAAEKKKEAEETAATVYVGDIGDPVELTFNNGTETLSFEKEDDVWYYAANKDLEIENDKVRRSRLPSGSDGGPQLEMAENASAYGLTSPPPRFPYRCRREDDADQFGDYCGSGDCYAQISATTVCTSFPTTFVQLNKTLEKISFVPESIPSVTTIG